MSDVLLFLSLYIFWKEGQRWLGCVEVLTFCENVACPGVNVELQHVAYTWRGPVVFHLSRAPSTKL